MRSFCDQEKMLLRSIQQVQLIGLDEAGITAYAGPISAGAVEPDPGCPYEDVVVDCKLLSSRELEQAFADVRIKSRAWAVAYASVAEVDRLGVQRASHLAMRRAARQIIDPSRTTVLLVDYTAVPGLHHLQWPLEEGDSIAASISAASVAAKYVRDCLMQELGKKHEGYGWESNKGCTTKAHKLAIQQKGLTPYHRKTWTTKILKQIQAESVELLHQPSLTPVSDQALVTSTDHIKLNEAYRSMM